MNALLIQVVSGLSAGGGLFLVAAGLTLIFGSLRLINVAHGSFYMYGAYLVSSIAGSSAGQDRYWLALVAAPLAVGVMGMVVDTGLMQRLYGREHLAQLLATFGLFYVLADVASTIWGKGDRTVSTPSALTGRVALLGGEVPIYNLFIIALAVAVGLGLTVLLRRSTLGWRIRAALDDAELLSTTGTDVRKLYTVVFALGALLAGLAGAVVAPTQALAPGMDQSILVDAFIVSIVGGIGSISGAALASCMIGIIEALGARWAQSLAPIAEYLVMILILALRPNGLLGRADIAEAR